MKFNVSLNELSFYAYHGIHEEETKIGNRYSLNITVSLFLAPDEVSQINKTIDYSVIANIAEKAMQIPTPLLETVVYNIANDILATFNQAQNVTVELFKHTPPLGILCKSSSVKIELNR